MSNPRAIIFDLDDTLYPHESFVQSGFAAAAEWLEAHLGVCPKTALKVMRHARAHGEQGREFQRVCRRYGLPVSVVPALVRVVRQHYPQIHLPEESRAVLAMLRPTWRIGVLTNGLPAVQRGKVRSLNLKTQVDCVVFAADEGIGLGKPDPGAFQAALDQLGVTADRAVVVGDDPVADIHGAGLLGIRTMHLSAVPVTWPEGVMPADVRVRSVLDVPQVAERLVPQEWANVA